MHPPFSCTKYSLTRWNKRSQTELKRWNCPVATSVSIAKTIVSFVPMKPELYVWNVYTQVALSHCTSIHLTRENFRESEIYGNNTFVSTTVDSVSDRAIHVYRLVCPPSCSNDRDPIPWGYKVLSELSWNRIRAAPRTYLLYMVIYRGLFAGICLVYRATNNIVSTWLNPPFRLNDTSPDFFFFFFLIVKLCYFLCCVAFRCQVVGSSV